MGIILSKGFFVSKRLVFAGNSRTIGKKSRRFGAKKTGSKIIQTYSAFPLSETGFFDASYEESFFLAFKILRFAQNDAAEVRAYPVSTPL